MKKERECRRIEKDFRPNILVRSSTALVVSVNWCDPYLISDTAEFDKSHQNVWGNWYTTTPLMASHPSIPPSTALLALLAIRSMALNGMVFRMLQKSKPEKNRRS
jgi:hypothetical protein